MNDFLKSRSTLFWIEAASVLLAVVGAVFFGLSYTTGYNQIVYGENNSIAITVLLAFAVLIPCAAAVSECLRAPKAGEICDLAAVAASVLFLLCLVLLLADRVDAIGNCIVAPWDAGHGGEDSCYLAFVSTGCWLAASVASIVGSFIGFRAKK